MSDEKTNTPEEEVKAEAAEAASKEEAPKADAPAEKAEAKTESAPAEEKPEGEARPAERRRSRQLPPGVAHIKSTFNNTLVSISDAKGNVLAWNSAGRAGFKGSRKSTAFAATVVGQDAARAVVSKGMREVAVEVQGPGAGRESAIRALQSAGLTITMIKDVTPMPHNGCRARKRRRV